jgi:hypothetical protein
MAGMTVNTGLECLKQAWGSMGKELMEDVWVHPPNLSAFLELWMSGISSMFSEMTGVILPLSA